MAGLHLNVLEHQTGGTVDTGEGDRRLLMVEFVVPERCRNDRAHFFPFYAGLARELNVPWDWIVFGTDYLFDAEIAKHGFYRVDLSEADRARLAAEVAAFQPTHIISSEIVSPEVMDAMRDNAPDAWFVSMSEWLWFGGGARPISQPEAVLQGAYLKHWETLTVDADTLPYRWMVPPFGEEDSCKSAGTRKSQCSRCKVPRTGKHKGCVVAGGRYLLDVVPEYRARVMNAEVPAIRPFIRIMGGHSCTATAPLKVEGFLEGIDLNHWSSKIGCTFCNVTGLDSRLIRYPRPHVEFAIAQIKRVLATIGTEGRNYSEYDIFDTHVFLDMEKFFAQVFAEKIPPGTFYFSPRIDDFLRKADTIETLMPQLIEAGHQIHVLRIGLENLAPAEQIRFNKGISFEQQRAAVRRIRALHAKYPKNFHYHDFGFILWSPWTSFDDLEVNFRNARELEYPLGPHEVSSCIVLDYDTPMLHATIRDGLYEGEEFLDPSHTYSAWRTQSWRPQQRAWRFKDARLEAPFEAVVRLVAYWSRDTFPLYFADDDPKFIAVRAFLDELPSCDRQISALAETLIRAGRDVREGGSIFDVLDDARKLLTRLEWRRHVGLPAVRIADKVVDKDAPPEPVTVPQWTRPGSRRLADRFELLQLIVDRLGTAPGSPFLGWSLERGERVMGDRDFQAHFVLSKGRETLDFFLLPNDAPQSGLVDGEHVKLSFSSGCTVDSGKTSAARSLVRIFDHYLARTPEADQTGT